MDAYGRVRYAGSPHAAGGAAWSFRGGRPCSPPGGSGGQLPARGARLAR
ncbi:MAG: hypothetical protein ABSF03_23740 [Streptosporangiaceae bacterium]